ncbi:UpxZ family of transcription anti-terminator antagonists [Bacteroides faecichinchillae]|uniref:UpxZ family of transcription anti-terminator antagonists n=1 Tax=Bacteroides faecichinchillae TaxID=871325 RepID=A0A1M5GTR8_9BACE|nr:UpxZ family transcription anti-terminator antagonist [Bacteroides faecichinchillae]SHG07067.1 UpxZ family of transcription anti-terminator antagonists [Bacteroides faecichinchillae]
MGNILLQEKIETLRNLADTLLHIGDRQDNVFVDDFTLLNKSIYDLINELYFQRGKTLEQEATLCLALLMGYSVSMYANPDDEFKKQSVLKRSRKILPTLPPSSVKEQLLVFCNELNNSFEIN